MTDLVERTAPLSVSPGGPVLVSPLPRRRRRGKALLNVVLVVLLVGLAAIGYNSIGRPKAAKVTPRTAPVALGVVQSTITATGNVAVAGDLAVNFTTAGKLVEVDVAVGDKVTRGQVLGRTDPFTPQENLKTAQSNLASAQARLVQLQTGLSPEEVNQTNIGLVQAAAQVDSANASLFNAQTNAAQNAISTQTAVNQATATLNTDQNTLVTDQNQLAADQASANDYLNQQSAAQAVVDADQARVTADQTKQFMDGCTSGGGNSGGGQTTSTTTSVCPTDAFTLQQDQARLSQDTAALNTVKSNATSANNAVTSGKTKVASDQAKITSDQNALTNAVNNQNAGALKDQQAIQSAQYSVNNAQLSYQAAIAAAQVKVQPPKVGDLAAAQSSVASAQVSVETAQKALDDTTLLSPADGTVATLNGAVGQNVAGGGATTATTNATTGAASNATATAFLTLTNLSTLQIKAGLSETDASKVKVGQPATVTLAALPGVGLAAHVASIDSTATVVSNVVTYNTVLLLDRTSDQVKPGMTASITIVIAERPSALHVPSAAVRGTGNNTTVTVLNGAQQVVTPVVVGLRGDDSVEILSGVKAGDAVVISSGASAGATTGTNNTTGRLPTGGAGIGGAGGLGGGGIGGAGAGGAGGGARQAGR
jgi:multidrug efflux pump subunit AcrA (membrane-fusion protein)